MLKLTHVQPTKSMAEMVLLAKIPIIVVNTIVLRKTCLAKTQLWDVTSSLVLFRTQIEIMWSIANQFTHQPRIQVVILPQNISLQDSIQTTLNVF